MIAYAVSGSMGEKNAAAHNDPSFHGMYGVNLAIMLREGTVGEIGGLDKITAHKNFLAMNKPGFDVGDIVCPEYIGTLSQTFTRIHLVGESFENLKNTIQFVFDTIKIKDTDGNSMLYTQFDYEVLDAWNRREAGF